MESFFGPMIYVFQMVNGKMESFLAYDMCLKWKIISWNHFWTNDKCVSNGKW